MVAFTASKSSIVAFPATRFSISAFLTSKFSILALVAVKSSMVALFAIKTSMVALYASNSFVLTLSATTNSKVPTRSDTELTDSETLSTLVVLADGVVTLPVTIALWSLIIKVTRSPSSISVVVSIGVNKSDPSIRTYLPSVPLTTVA